jgi:hypothetical protein
MAKSDKYSRKHYKRWLQMNYPLYVDLHDWLTDVLYAMQPNPFDPIEIEIDDPKEPHDITIKLHTVYSS